MNKVLFREFTDASTMVPMEMSLLDRHNLYFENRLADGPELLEIAHALRYQVYVRERNFENPEHHAEGLEIDAFDGHSLQGLVFHRPTGEAIGTARLIQPLAGDPDSLPIGPLLRENGFDIAGYVPLETSVEISRFAISKSFRRRINDDRLPGAPALSREERVHRGNLVCLSLMQFLVRHAVEIGATHYTAVMEEKLLRMLAGMGLHFTPVGPIVNHHGLRQPAFSHIGEMMERCRREQPQYWDVLTNEGEYIEKLNRRIMKQPLALAS